MHKKTLNLLAICIVVLVVAFVYIKKNEPEKKVAYGNNVSVDGAEQGEVARFTDEDSYQTDLLQVITEQQVAAFTKVSDSFKKSNSDNLSQSIAKDVFSEYLKYNNSGELDIAQLQNITAANLKNQQVNIPKTSIQALTVIGSTIPNLQQYTKSISEAQQALNKKVASVSKYTNPAPYIRALYTTTAKLLVRVPVPENIAKYHIQLINGLENYAGGIGLMELQAKDPASALLGLQAAQAGNTEVVDALKNLKRIINLNNIVYNKGDMTYAWLLDIADTENIKTQ